MRRLIVTLLVMAVLGVVCTGSVSAGTLPFRNGEVIKLVCPFGPGGGFDRILRLIQPFFEKALNTLETGKSVSVIVENRKGAGGRVAYEYTYNSPPDGTRMVLIGDQGAGLQQLSLNANFDLDKFTYFARVNMSDWGILVRKDTGIKDMNDLIKRSHEKPILFGTSGAGSGDHIASVLLQAILKEKGVEFPIEYAHFGSSAKVTASMMRGEAETYIGSVESVLAPVKDGYSIMSVVFAKKRSAYYPDVPTIFEQKILGAEEISDNIGLSRALVGPPGIPADKVAALREGLRAALADPDFLTAAKKAQLPVIYGSGEEAKAMVKGHTIGLVHFKDLVNAAIKGK